MFHQAVNLTKPTSNSENRLNICAAARQGNIADLNASLAQGQAINQRDNINMTPFLLATKYGQLETLRWLKAQGADQWLKNDKYSALYYVMYSYAGLASERKAIVEYLLTLGFNLPPAFLAICRGVETLDVSLTGQRDNDYGYSALHCAATWGNTNVVKQLIQTGQIEKNEQANVNQETALHLAARNGQLAVVQWLVQEAKVEAAIKKNDGWTPLHSAAQNGHLTVVQWLVQEAKVAAGIKDKDGWTPLHSAAKNGHLAVVQWFIKRTNVPIDIKTNSGTTPLASAATNNAKSVELWLILASSILAVKNARAANCQAVGQAFKAIQNYQECNIEFKKYTISLLLELLQSSEFKSTDEITLERNVLAQFTAWHQAFDVKTKMAVLQTAIELGDCILLEKLIQINNNLLNFTRFEVSDLQLNRDMCKLLGEHAFKSETGITALSLQRVKFVNEESYQQFLKGLAGLSAHLEELVLEQCDLTDEQIGELAEAISAFSQLNHVLLDGNSITLRGLKLLLRQLPASVTHLRLLVNYIEFKTLESFIELCQRLSQRPLPVQVDITGNAIFSVKRSADMLILVSLLLVKSRLTIDDFLQTQFSSLRKRDADYYELTLLQQNGLPLSITLTRHELALYNKLKNQEVCSDEDVIQAIAQRGLSHYRLQMPDALLTTRFSEISVEARKACCKQLIDYHPTAPLKGQINTSHFFKSTALNSAPSLLFPKQALTRTQGYAYILAKKSDEHAMIGYEYLTGYGQRFFRIAHLTVEQGKRFIGGGQIIIDFFTKDLDELIPYLQENYIIAALPAAKSELKALHQQIEEDKQVGVNAKYKWLISGSSQVKSAEQKEKEIQNCLKWVIDRINRHTGITLTIKNIYQPSAVVKTLIDNPSALLGPNQPLEVIGILNSPNASTSKNNCLVM